MHLKRALLLFTVVVAFASGCSFGTADSDDAADLLAECRAAGYTAEECRCAVEEFIRYEGSDRYGIAREVDVPEGDAPSPDAMIATCHELALANGDGDAPVIAYTDPDD